MKQRDDIIRIFPDYMKERLEQVLQRADKLQEIRLAVGCPVRVLFAGEEKFLSATGTLSVSCRDAWYITEWEMDEIIKNICRYSMYAYENEIRQGFLTIPGGHRIGMAGQVVLNENGSVRNITHIRFMNIRISHEVIGAAKTAIPYLYKDNRFLNTLLISPPGCGKTTLLRDIVRLVSEGNHYGKGRQVGVVDERSEIAGSFRGIPQNNVGMRTDVLDGCPKAQGMMLLMRSMAPSVVAVDEIGGYEDMRALFQVLQCGSSVVATMHGNSMEDVESHLGTGKKLQSGDGPFERYLFLEKKKGICRIKEIFDKSGNRIYSQEAERLCCG